VSHRTASYRTTLKTLRENQWKPVTATVDHRVLVEHVKKMINDYFFLANCVRLYRSDLVLIHEGLSGGRRGVSEEEKYALENMLTLFKSSCAWSC